MGKPGPKPKVRPRDVLTVFDRRDDRGEPLTAPELAEALNCSRRTALNRLGDLDDDGLLRSKQVGGRSRVYWTPIDGRSTESDRERTENDAETPVDSKAPHAPRERSDAPEDLEAAIDATGLDAERREALRAMYAYLSEHGTARKSDFTNDVYPDHSAGYGSPGGWWNRLGKDALASLPDVSKPAEGRPTWRFSGE